MLGVILKRAFQCLSKEFFSLVHLTSGSQEFLRTIFQPNSLVPSTTLTFSINDLARLIASCGNQNFQEYWYIFTHFMTGASAKKVPFLECSFEPPYVFPAGAANR